MDMALRRCGQIIIDTGVDSSLAPQAGKLDDAITIIISNITSSGRRTDCNNNQRYGLRCWGSRE
jgi:hypothetical protein